MGSIAGCLALAEGTSPDAGWVDRAIRRIAYRGPDDEGRYSDDRVALAASSLAVLSAPPAGRRPSPAGAGSSGAQQPVRSVDGRYVLVFDGFLANYQELGDKLRARGVMLRTGSDAEVLLETFALDGKSALRQLRGMYAFVLWDSRDNELLCCRDPFGIKPLYYSLGTGRFFRFASERKALAAAGDVTSIDPDALRRYLSLQYVPAPRR